MKRTYFFKSTLLVLITFFTFSCSKDEPLKNAFVETTKENSVFPNVPIVDSLIEIDESNVLVQKFFSIEGIEKSKVLNQIQSIYSVKFKNLPTLKGLHFVVSTTNLLRKDLFFVYDTISNNYLSVIRILDETANKYVKKLVKFTSINGINISNELAASPYTVSFENSLIKSNTYISNTTIASKIKSQLSWNCTEQQFNQLYKEAKNKCESDWLCDFACTFNPCAISYVAYAVGKCTNLIK